MNIIELKHDGTQSSWLLWIVNWVNFVNEQNVNGIVPILIIIKIFIDFHN